MFKKLISLILIFTLLLCLTTVSATVDMPALLTSEEKANALKYLGLFVGTDTGFELDRAATRTEAVVMLLRMLGKAQEASNSAYSHPFKDVPSWANKYIAYAYAKELTSGISSTAFGANDIVTPEQFMTFTLRALEYSDKNGDFTYKKAIMKAEEIGLADVDKYTAGSKSFTRGDCVDIIYKALTLTKKVEKISLIESLVNSKIITAAKAEDYELHATPIGVSTVTQNFAIKEDGTLWAWGANEYGLVGNGTTELQKFPIKIMSNVASIHQGEETAFAIKKDDSLWAWGSNWHGQIGNGGKGNDLYHWDENFSYNIQTVPVKVLDNVAEITYYFWSGVVALKKDGSLWSWGGNTSGNSRLDSPRKLIDEVASYVFFGGIYVIKKDNSLWFWGLDKDSILTGKSETNSTEVNKPTKIMDNVSSIKINSEGNHIAILKKDGTLWTCGTNIRGEVGNGTSKIQRMPVKVLDKVKTFELGSNRSYNFMAAIRTDNSLWMWGCNTHGQIGNGHIGDAKDHYNDPFQTKPVKILDDVSKVYLGEENQVQAIKKDGSLWVWGYSTCVSDFSRKTFIGYNRDEMDTCQSVPAKLTDDVISVYNFEGSTLALKGDNSLWAWGNNRYGTVGNGKKGERTDDFYGGLFNQYKPIRILDNVKTVMGNFSAIQYDGTLWRWGLCSDYSLGNGTEGTSLIPTSTTNGFGGNVRAQSYPVPIFNQNKSRFYIGEEASDESAEDKLLDEKELDFDSIWELFRVDND